MQHSLVNAEIGEKPRQGIGQSSYLDGLKII
jgi:hypothetical protein